MSIFNKWKNGLSKTSRATFGQIATFLGATQITAETYEDLEALLVQADLGIETTEEMVESLRERIYDEGLVTTNQLRTALAAEMRERLVKPPEIKFEHKPTVILVVGVNGSGKTTSIAKLGWRWSQQGKKVLLGAADTYRAAAVDQLQVWADRLDLPVIAGQQGGDAGAVTFDAIKAGQARSSDVVLIDTAGRLHTRFNLMEELKKVYRVSTKAMDGAPHHVWLVMDATTGQNAMHQARAFKEAVNVTGIILAKLDSSARGGMAFAIRRELDLPIMYAGLGEQPDDLQPFDPDAFIRGVVGEHA